MYTTFTVNRELRHFLKVNAIPLWQIAKKYGCSENTLSRKLREELSDKEQRKLLDYAAEILAERRNFENEEEIKINKGINTNG